ncbi:unnamed protein product [Closterium sp. NIES-53]
MLLTPEGDPDALDIPTPRSYVEAIEGPYSSQWQAAMDAEMASWKSTGTYIDEVPPPGANIVSGMWIFRVKRPPGSPPAFKARYVARGFSKRQGPCNMKRCSSKVKGGRGGGGGSGGGGGGSSGGSGGSGGGGSRGVVAGVGALAEVVVAAVGVAVVVAVGVVAVGLELLSVERGASGGSGSCPYVIRTGDRAGQTCGKPHTQHRCFSHPDDACRAEFGDEAERPRWAELLRFGVAIFDLDYDAILATMYALSASTEGPCYLCVPPDLGIEAAS